MPAFTEPVFFLLSAVGCFVASLEAVISDREGGATGFVEDPPASVTTLSATKANGWQKAFSLVSSSGSYCSMNCKPADPAEEDCDTMASMIMGHVSQKDLRISEVELEFWI